MIVKRVLTAAVLIPVVLLLIFELSSLFFGLLSALLLTYAAWEWSALAGLSTLRKRWIYTLAL